MVKRNLHKLRKPGDPRGGRGKPCKLTINKKSVHMQRWFLNNPWVRPFIVFSFAASKIQKIMRAYLIRRHARLTDYLYFRYDITLQNAQGNKTRNTIGKQVQLDKYLAYMDYCRNMHGETNFGKKIMRPPAWTDGGYSAWCAVRVQAWYRGQVVRRRYLYKIRVIVQIAALVLQHAWRNYVNRMIALVEAANKKIIPPVRASVMIQLAWRSHCNRRIYGYYRDLVVNKLQGAPQDLLRTIIPTESSLLDRASGVVARFRLGGAVFPPKVYFKIFTYRGVCDVNAFAPRDYAKEVPQEAFQQNIQSQYIPKDRAKYNRNIRVGGSYFGTKVLTATSTDTWYKREENNNWRPLASQLFEDVLTPPWMRDSVIEKKPAPFHFSQLKRKTDQIRLRKQKKREWLRKAYIFAGAAADNEKEMKKQQQDIITETKISISKTQNIHDAPQRSINMATNRHGKAYDEGDRTTNRTYSAERTNGQRKLDYNSGNHNGTGNGSIDDDDDVSESLAYLSMSNTLDGPSMVDKRSFSHPQNATAERKVRQVDARVPAGPGYEEKREPAGLGGNYQQILSSQGRGSRPGSPSAALEAAAKFRSSARTHSDFKATTYSKGRSSYNEKDETEDLLQWSMALDYDDYASDWSKIGTSVPSDAEATRLYA
jgi:hypothetical protein